MRPVLFPFSWCFYLELFYNFEHRHMMSTALISLLDSWVREAVACHGDGFAHPAIQQIDKFDRRHARMFKIEEQFKIKDPS